MTFLFLLFWICSFYLTNLSTCQEIDSHENVNVSITRLFVHKIPPGSSWNPEEMKNGFRYTVTSMEGPDIPPWLHVKYVKKTNEFYIFGAAPEDLEVEMLELQVCITSLYSYKTIYLKKTIWFDFIEETAKNEVHLQISNLSIEEMLKKSRQNSLIEIFEEHFWRTSKGKLYITFLAESHEAGYQLNRNDSSGVVLHLGSTANFSEELFSLQNETMPLTKHCPSIFKRTTVERFFRPKNFTINWCSFKLVSTLGCSEPSAKNDCNALKIDAADSVLNQDTEFLVAKEELPKSSIHGIFTLFVFVPSVFFGLVVTSWLSSFMCFNNKKLNDPYSDDYFETIFFVCEDFVRKRDNIDKKSVFEENDPDDEMFHF